MKQCDNKKQTVQSIFRRSMVASAITLAISPLGMAHTEIPASRLHEQTPFIEILDANALPPTAASLNLLPKSEDLQITQGGSQIIFIDSAVDDYQTLVNGVAPGAEVYLLDKQQDGVHQIASILGRYSNVQAVHIIAHGEEASVQLGNATFDAYTLSNNYQREMQTIKNALAEGADMLVHSCNTGSGTAGRQFVEELALVTGADIAASDDMTGNVSQGGDWDLEISTGSIEISQPFSQVALKEFPGVLAVYQSGVGSYTTVSTGGTYGLTGDTYGGTRILYTKAASSNNVYSYGGTNNALYIYDTGGTSDTFHFKANGSTLGTFDISDIALIGQGTNNTWNVTVTGYDSGDGYLGKAMVTGLALNTTSSTSMFGAGADFSAFNDVYRFTVTISGATVATFGIDSFTLIDERAPNNAPTSPNTTQTVNFTEDTTAAIADMVITDTDSNTWTATMTMAAGDNSLGALSASSGNGETFTTGTGVWTVTSATLSNVNNALAAMSFVPTANVSTNTTATVSISDGVAAAITGTITFSGTAINDAPTNIALSATTINQSATGAAVIVGNLSSTDIDSGAFTYTLVSSGTAANGLCGVGNDADNASFQISTASFETGGALSAGTYDVCLQTNDTGTTFEKTFAITVTDNVAPTISAVSIPNSAHKVGDTVTATITVTSDADDYTTGSGAITGTINGYTLGSLSKTNNTTYTATFTVTDGGTDVAAGSNIATSFTLTDSSGNTSVAFTTAISQASDAIYANLPTVDLTASSNTLAEDGGTSTLSGTLSGSLNNQWPADVTVNLAYTGTGTITTDYTGAASITVSAGNTTGTTVVTSVADTVFDAAIAETIIVDINSLSVGSEGITNQQTLSITDAESAPITTLSVGNATVAENGGTSTITAALSNATYADVTVNLGYSGTATLGGTDANTPSASITIPAGSTSANTVTGITSVDDVLGEGNETIVIDIASVSGGSATENLTQQQTVTITDDEDTAAPTISAVSIPNSAHKVGDTVTATITVTSDADDYTTGSGAITGAINGYTLGSLSKTNNTTYTAIFTVTDGGTDVAAGSNIATNFTLTDSTGNTSSAFTTAISQVGDAIYANLPTVDLTANTNTLAEDGGTSTLTGTLSGSLNNQWPADVTVNLAYTGTGTITTDYTGAASITVSAGNTAGTTVITSLADTVFDAAIAETVIVDISSLSVGSEGTTNQQTLSITDAESAPTTTLSVGNATVAENGGTSIITATLNTATYADVTVNLGYSGTATSGGTDYNTPSASITIPAGSTTANAVAGVTSVDDVLGEGNETIVIDIASVSGGSASESGTQQQTVTITDDEDTAAPTISAVSIPNSAHKVGDTVTATITVTSDADDYTTGSGGISGTVNGYTLGSLSKTNNTTYTATFTITDGGSDVAAGSNIATNFTLTDSAGNASSAFTTAINQASDSIYANLPTVDLTASTNTLAEDGGTSTLTGTLSGSLNNQWPVDVTVNLAYTGTGTITSDYTGAASITVSAGNSSGTTVVTSLADTVFDAAIAETIIVDINSLSVGNEGTTNQQTLSITDAESAPTTTLSVGNATVAENGGTSIISAMLNTATYADVTVNLGYSGTATSGGTDYNTPSASITIPAGSTSANAVTGITSVDDVLGEGNETIVIDIASVSGGSASESGVQQQTVTITDDEDTAAPTISAVSIPNSAHKVGDTVTATITVTSDADDYTTGSGAISGTINGYTLGGLSKTNNTTYTATFTVTDGGTDVAAVSNIATSFTLTDSTGNTSGAFTTAISQASDAIYANLPTVDLTANTNTLAEDGGTSTLSGTLSGSLNNQWPVDVTVNLAYTGTGTITSDYTGAASITVSAGNSSGTTVVTSLADTVFDAAIAETIIVDINSLSVGSEGTTNQQTLSITDAESAPITTLSVGNATVAENGGTSTITAALSNATYADVTVNLGYSGTATLGGTDANTPSASITIPAGSTSANAVTGVTAINDALAEVNETIIVDVTSVAGGSATESGVQQQTVSITDDDTPNVSLSVSANPIAEAGGTSTLTATLSQVTFEDVIVTLGYTGTATDVSDYTKTNTITVLAGTLTGSTTLTAVTDALADGDETVIVDVTGVSGGTAVENATQQQTVTITDNLSPANTVLPAITGNAIVGVNLTTTNGTWNDAENDTLSFTYQWKAAGVDIALATTNNYTLTSAEEAKAITVVVSASDSINPVASATSAATSAVDGDLDGDGTGDSLDTDIDGDGMTNTFETDNGLDPLDPADATEDLDGDGVSNLGEFTANTDPTADDYPPVVTAPIDVTVDATGLFTAITLDAATAVDTLDGSLITTSDAPTHFKPGVNAVTWTAVDAAGNTDTAVQTVNVKPLVDFSKDQMTSEGSTVSFDVILNGDAVTYPVIVPYTVGGTAATDSSDHSLVDGVATINSGTSVSVNFTVVDDGAGEGIENIVITMGTPTNAVNASSAMHSIDVVEGNVAPVTSLEADQGSGATRAVTVGDGSVTVTATVVDPNVTDTISYDWSATDNALIETDAVESTFTFDPSALSAGIYTLRLSVSDGTETEATEITLNVLATAPTLTTTDSDGDGTDDQTEGYGDNDNDGVPDYLDAISSTNVLQELSGESKRYLIETEPGLSLSLSSVSFQAANGQAQVSSTDITNAGSMNDDAASYDYAGGLFNFNVSDLPVAGASVKLVLPQLSAIPAQAVYRKLVSGVWQDFVINTNNSVASAAGEQGYCPPPGDAAYQTGLTAGHWCVQLTIEDGGANDADGTVNNRVVDPGGVARILSTDVEVNVSSSGGGLLNPIWLALLGLLGISRLQSRNKKEES